ncbi:PilN domain-containing protein [Natranaerobius thermophilus]|uniref:Fimbrial assembly family protein n=1 Tax=Natranaerobius thermophilus (strain ATCC BAA-1301 / DSM 18059 / JW/NM-WN-LF) TaxID=457570 RepID=B2A7F7_NATTJ|nr:PilN domain-containing protein [Natranaerobius thermophilus]ACB85666.1 Fimbrial assembly family protein [Natranaerobius thermophilus JW/NM-WN-LF]
MTIKPDLRLPEYKTRDQINWYQLFLIIILVGFLGLLGMGFGLMQQELASLENRLEQLEQLEQNLMTELEDYDNLGEMKEEYELKTERIEKLESGHISWSQHFEELSQNMPQGLWLEEYTAAEPEEISISGYANTVFDVMVFLQELETNTHHEQLELDSLTEGEGAYYFNINGELDVTVLEWEDESQDNQEADDDG